MKPSNAAIKEKEAQTKRFLMFLILILMVMSLTMCKMPTKQEVYGDLYQQAVDPSHPLPDHWTEMAELVTAQNSLGEVFLVEKETKAHFDELREALLKEKIDIELAAAYRTAKEQKEAYEEAQKNGETAAAPGYSDYQTGMAVDVFLIENGEAIREKKDLLAKEDVFAKIHAKLAEHGFILGVLPGKENLCGGLPYEPWHFRYVRVEPAKEIYEKGLVLSEYSPSEK